MSGLVFLVAAVSLSVVGSVALWLWHRQPKSLEQGIDEFSREMQALAPGAGERPHTHRRGQRRA